jgi:predicted ArsR family transcriptional regulator
MNKEIESRRVSVERLANEGNTSDEIAEILEVPGRTIRRDMEAIREASVIARDEKFLAGQVIKLLARAEGRMGGLVKLAGRNDCPYEVRLGAELGAWKVAKELAQELRAMGYLPNAAREVRADVTHRIPRQASFSEMHARVVEFERVVKEAGRMDEETEKEIAALKAIVATSRETEKV